MLDKEDVTFSRSEKKRRAKQIEGLAQELFALGPAEVKKLPCPEPVRAEILLGLGLKAGARKRQMKYVTKMLREEADFDTLFEYLEQRKGSKLKEAREFHSLERLRDAIVNEAIAVFEEEVQFDTSIADYPEEFDWPSRAAEQAAADFPEADIRAIKKAAMAYARSRNLTFSREIFRLLKAARDRARILALRNEK